MTTYCPRLLLCKYILYGSEIKRRSGGGSLKSRQPEPTQNWNQSEKWPFFISSCHSFEGTAGHSLLGGALRQEICSQVTRSDQLIIRAKTQQISWLYAPKLTIDQLIIRAKTHNRSADYRSQNTIDQLIIHEPKHNRSADYEPKTQQPSWPAS